MKPRRLPKRLPFKVDITKPFTDAQLAYLVRRGWEQRQCTKCGQDKGHTGPCPYCADPSILANKAPNPTPPTFKGSIPYSKTVIGRTYDSVSQPGVVYQVRVTPGKKFVSCSCPGYFYRKECRHMREWMEEHK